LGRTHTTDDFLQAISDARNAGFTNINADLIAGIPGQTLTDAENDVKFLLSLKLPHISLYGLKIEENTRLYKIRNALNIPDEDKEGENFAACLALLRSGGLERYEISNFALPGFESRHNLVYWNADEYIGVGASAHAYFKGYRYYYTSQRQKYTDGDYEKLGLQYIDNDEKEREYIMLRLRLSRGILFSDYKKRFARPFPNNYLEKAEKYVKAGYAKLTAESLSLSDKGMAVSNQILTELI
jgi:oxygen-independent coproporphyrinogen-3 oxidase